MYACPRDYCGGSRLLYGGQVQCVLCARGEVLARPPTAKEAGDRRLEKSNVTNYFIGVYAIDYTGQYKRPTHS